MADDTDTRDRVIRLETKVEHLSDKIESSSKKIEEMHVILLQAKGARWALLGLVGAGGFGVAKLSTVAVPWLSFLPK